MLEDTIFYPVSGGQPHDTGKLVMIDGEEFNVVYVGKFDDGISHEVDRPGLKEGDRVKCIIDWNRRYKHMRTHTAAHIISGVLHDKAGALITGNQITQERLSIDFNLENFDREEMQGYVGLANEAINRGIEVKHYFLPREEAMQIKGLVKLANAMPPDLDVLRIVEIPGIDISADGGTHVKNTREVGGLRIIKFKNKGKNNRRMYVELV